MSYPTHMPLASMQKGMLTLLSAAGALLRPARADLVATVGETTGLWAAGQLRSRMQACEEGRVILVDRPRVTDASVAHCTSMPAGTFGAAYAQFMSERHFHADDRPPVRFVDDEELAYVLTRSREVHDFWHVLFDLHTNVFGELALKALEFVQTGLPMTGLAVLGAQFRLPSADRQLLQEHYLPWALRAGTRCQDLMCIRYEHYFEEPLVELRSRWKIDPAPVPPAHLRRRMKRQQQDVANSLQQMQTSVPDQAHVMR